MRGFRSAGWFRARRGSARGGPLRRVGVVVLVLAMSTTLMGAGSPGRHTPMPTWAGIRATVVRFVDWATDKTPAKPILPEQASGSVPGKQHPVPASVTRAIARAEGYKPGNGPGQLPAYAFPAAKVKQHIATPAGLGGVASFSPAASKAVASGSTATSPLYRNTDGSYTRLQYPRQTAAGKGAVTFAALAGTGVKGARVTSVALRVRESWTGRCPSSATVSVTDAAGQQVGRWVGRPTASACGGGASGEWVTVPLSSAGVKALSGKGGAGLTVTATPAATQPAEAASAKATPATTATTATPVSTAGASSTGTAELAVTAATTAPPQVDSQWPSDGYNSPSLTPELIATGQTFNGSTPNYQFTLYDSTGTWLTATPWQTADDWVVPAGTLSWAQTYYWTVRVFDSTDTGSVDPQAFALSTPVPQPLVSSGLAQDGTAPGDAAAGTGPDDAADSNPAGTAGAPSDDAGPGYDAQNGNFTIQATDAGVAVTGPALSVQRTYNSLNGSTSGAFGTGWSTVLDMSVRPGQQADSGSTATQIVTYPDGEQVAFGLNSDGQTYTPPQGRFGSLIPNPGGGFQLVDKDDTTYTLGQSLGSNVWGITSIADAQDHTLNFTYSGGHVTKIESAVSQRSLYLTWSTVSGATHAHVASVATDPVTPNQSSTAITWQYTYTGDQLGAACNESQSGTPCTKYGYTPGSDYPSAVLDSGPQSYWRLDEASGSTAASSVLANEGADNASYVNTWQAGVGSPLAGEPSSVGAVGFDGTNAYVQTPASLGDDGAVSSVSLWFDTDGSTSQALLSQSADPITKSSTTNPYTPIMYIGSDGRLRAGFAGTGTPLSSASAVNNDVWHNAVLTSTGSQETLYIDGVQVASTSATTTPFIEPYTYLGAGFLGGSYPDETNSGKTAAPTYFAGALSDTAVWDRPLAGAEVSGLYTAGTTTAALATTITRPSAKTFEQATYNGATSHVTGVTDSNGGSWTVNAPSASGTSQVYTAAVKGGQPVDYWRLGDTGTTTAVNQLHGGTATYSNVTQGVSGGPFADTTVDGFNGTSSYLSLPNSLITAGNESVSLWFKTTGTDEVLLSSSVDSPANGNSSNAFTPNLYVGEDGLLNGEFFYDDAPMASTTAVNDGKWHNVVITSDADDQYLYLDGEPVGSVTGQTISGGAGAGQNQVVVGTGFLGYVWADQAHYSTTSTTGYPSYFNGDIADVAVYPHLVSAGDVTAQWAAAQHSAGLSPVETATATDPGQHTLTYQYDPLNSGRMLSQTDGLGFTTTYGYDSGGFQDQVIDPDGDFTDSGYDIRGNVVATTSCQNQSTLKCSTSYSSYTPDDKASQLTAPWSGNDLVQTSRDPRSSSSTDNTYLTTDTYDSSGDLTKQVGPPVPGFSSGRTTNYSYTDGSTTAGSGDGSVPPAGLLWKTVTPGGAVTETLYNAHGDILKSINANDVTTSYSYDGIGRKTSEKVVSDTETAGLTTGYTYNANGQVTQESDPPVTDKVTGVVHTEQVTTAYDLDGDVTSQVTADTTGGDTSRTVSYTYNGYDQKASSTDGAKAVTSYTYDAYGNQAGKKDPAGNVTDYTYDPDGHLLTTTLVGYTGSPAGSQSAKNVTVESRAYDPAGRLATVTDAMDRVTSYTYTDNDLTAKITRSGPGYTGNYVQEADTYDAAGNLVAKVTDNGATTTDYAVDADGQVTSQTVDPNGLDRVTSYTYDGDDHVATQNVSQGSGTSIQSTSYTYDAMGNKTSETVQDPGAEGPAAWWTLTQGSGTTVADTSGTGNQANATGVTWTGGGAQLSGQGGQVIKTRGPVVDTTGSFSVSAWVDMSAKTGNDEDVASQDAGSVAGFYLKYNSATGTWQFARPEQDENNPSNWATADSGTAAKTGTWTFLTGVYNVNTGAVQLYVNGADTGGDTTDSTPIAADGPAEIGAAKWDGQTAEGTFDGSLTNVEIYPTALSATEVSNLYGQGSGGGDLVRDALTTGYTVDELGQVTAQTDPDGVTTTYAYDAAGHQTVVTDPTVATETAVGTPVVKQPATTTGYNTFGDVAETQDANGNTTTYTYDGDGRQLTKTLPAYTPPGGSAVNGTSTTQYNGLGEVTSQTDPDNNQTTYTYDQLGNKTSQTDVTSGATTSYAYDLDNELLSTTGPTGAQTTATYDFLGRQATATDVERYLTPGSTTQSATPGSYTTTTSYAPTTADPSGTWKSSVTSPDGVASEYGYDAVGENTQVTDGVSNVTTYDFDALGRQVKTVNPDQTADTITYDPAGNEVAQASLDKNGNTLTSTSSTYNGEGDQLSATDARGDTTTFTYNAIEDTTAETQPVTSTSAIVTSFGYDAAGNQTAYTDGNGNQRLTTYNSRELPQTQVEPSTSAYSSTANTTTTIAYNGDGQTTSETEPGGVNLAYSYNSLNELTGQTGSGATAPTATRAFTYNTAGQMLTATTTSTADSSATSETLTYNDRGMVTGATGSAGSTSLGYNGDGQPASVQDTAGTSNYSYDSDGRLKTMNDPASGATLTYSYNQMSQPSTIAYSGSSADTQTFGYNTLHQTTSDTLTSGTTTVASVGYQYDANGNLTTKTTTGFAGAGTNTYTYDQADRLSSWNNGSSTTAYAYDADGNRTQAGTATYTYDARDELTSDGTNTYSYSAGGDLASVSNPTSGTTTSTSDAYGQQGAQGGQSDTYDALGRDVSLTNGTTTTNLSYQDTTGQLTSDGSSDYTWTAEGTLVGTEAVGAQGSGVLDLTNTHTDVTGQFTATGSTLTGSQNFGPWGTVLATAGTLDGGLGYQSQYTSPATGETDMGARWYNPITGSFGNKDTVSNKPVPNSASASPFGYAADNPLDATDPSGHMAVLNINGVVVPATDTALIKSLEAAQAAAAKKEAAAKAAAAQKALLEQQLKTELLIGGVPAVTNEVKNLKAVGTPAAKTTATQFLAAAKKPATITLPTSSIARSLGTSTGKSTAKPTKAPPVCSPSILNIIKCPGLEPQTNEGGSGGTSGITVGGEKCGVSVGVDVGEIDAPTIDCTPTSSSASEASGESGGKAAAGDKVPPRNECSATCVKVLVSLASGFLNAVATANGAPKNKNAEQTPDISGWQEAVSFLIGAGSAYLGTLIPAGVLSTSIIRNTLLGIAVGLTNNAFAQLTSGQPFNGGEFICAGAEAGVVAETGGAVAHGFDEYGDPESLLGGSLPGGLAAVGTGIKDPASFCPAP
jgi:RHS repeat-associated protein